jgi:POT family proton-dependent oligopeptide transporter
MLTGYLGGKLGTMPDTTFWLMHVGIMAVSAAILLVVRFAFAHLVAPTRPN